MSRVWTCLLCGREAPDVQMGLVEFRPAEQRVVTVTVVLAEARIGRERDHREVREQFGHLPRCQDHVACADRVAAIEAAERAKSAAPADPLPDRELSTAHEEDVAWMP